MLPEYLTCLAFTFSLLKSNTYWAISFFDAIKIFSVPLQDYNKIVILSLLCFSNCLWFYKCMYFHWIFASFCIFIFKNNSIQKSLMLCEKYAWIIYLFISDETAF